MLKIYIKNYNKLGIMNFEVLRSKIRNIIFFWTDCLDHDEDLDFFEQHLELNFKARL